MPLSWDPRRMWSDNPSAAGASKALPNEEIVTDSSPKAVSTAFAARSASPKRFRFVKGVSRPKKRRRANSPKEQASRSAVTESSPVTPEIVRRTAAQNSESFDDHQRANSLAGLADRAVEPALHNLQTSSISIAQNIDMFRDEPEQNVLGDLVPRTTQEPTNHYDTARLEAASMLSEISSNDHDKLLELLCPLRYRELVNSPDAGAFSAPSPWRPQRIDDTSN
ncbi:uncharacterized protein N7500_002787 [Penicillium coprophilum]|uniref:uncharacterized protein n=1 Tax=Penicillium coprophilum TaxID=36646 RepID=UPI002388B66E|nr:uncharacterized protein N7500_002787 [Penicillium coprophilum]KAJ5170004.1 hypothetical protein N7500_002787 [Penicillium coprophilum]